MPNPSSSAPPDRDRSLVQGHAGQHPAGDADHHGPPRGRPPRRHRPGRHRRHHLRRIPLRRRRSRPLRGRLHAGCEHVPGQSVNRHCAGSLTAIGNASAQIGSGHGARADRRRCAVAVDDAADELAHPRPGAEVRGALDAADARRDAGCAGQGHVDHRRLEHRAGRRASPARRWTRGPRGRTSAPIAAIDAGKFLDEIMPLKVAAARRLGGRLQRRRAPAPRHHRREAGRAQGAAPGDRGLLDHRGQRQRHQRRLRRGRTGRPRLRRGQGARRDGDREGLGRRSACAPARHRARRRRR